YPDKPVRLIVPFAAGGPTDIVARLIAQKLSESWGQQVYVENVAGASGNIGTRTVARAAPDGYTVLVTTSGFVVNPSLYANIPYDPIKDFAPITIPAASCNVLIVHPSIPATTVKELVALVKANPGKYSFASAGVGQTSHLAGELLNISYGIDRPRSCAVQRRCNSGNLLTISTHTWRVSRWCPNERAELNRGASSVGSASIGCHVHIGGDDYSQPPKPTCSAGREGRARERAPPASKSHEASMPGIWR